MAAFDYPNGDLLVSADWLAQHLNDPPVKIIDVRSAKDYGEGHVPGALLLPNGAFRSTSGIPNACTPEAFATTAGALGVCATDTVMCYDGTGPPPVWRYATLSTPSGLVSPHRGRAEDEGPLAHITCQRLCRHLPIVLQSTAQNLGIVEEMAHADLLVFAQRH